VDMISTLITILKIPFEELLSSYCVFHKLDWSFICVLKPLNLSTPLRSKLCFHLVVILFLNLFR
jgi:hypothetical protein